MLTALVTALLTSGYKPSPYPAINAFPIGAPTDSLRIATGIPKTSDLI